MRVAAQLFGVGISTVAGIQHQLTAAIIKHFGNKVHWPSTDEELLKISEDFARIWDYPLCIGSVDGCHIPCSPKAADATDFYNYKGWYSTILFAVADASYKFIYFNVGCPGRMNDGFIFRRSALKEKLEAQAEQFLRLGRSYDGIQIPLHLIGDCAFPLVHNLMKPYLFEIEPVPQPVQDCMWFLAFMSFSVIVCLYQHINVLHEKAKLHDDLLACRLRTAPTFLRAQ